MLLYKLLIKYTTITGIPIQNWLMKETTEGKF